jgi:hypothetical protein
MISRTRTLAMANFLAAFAGILLSQTPPQPGPPSKYDPAIFQNPIPPDRLQFLSQFDGAPSKDLIQEKQFRKLLHDVLPDCVFHYGWDMPLADAVDKVIKGSPLPVRIRDGRYLTIAGRMGPYLGGRGFVWIDLQDGIALGGFYFHPTNGEPTPALNVFSKQVKVDAVAMGQLPPAFAEDLWLWSAESRVPPLVARYFITGDKKKILLEHDEDYCTPPAWAIPPGPGAAPPPPPDVCQQMNADAADIDLIAAYYLEQTHHATNATAWMIDPAAAAWIQLRNNTCGAGPNPLGCRIVMTRERIRVVLRQRIALPPPSRR